MKNKAFHIAMIVYIILFIADIVTTLLNSNILASVELNPLYRHIGIFGIVALNFIVLALIYLVYLRRKSSPTTRFMLFNFIVTTMCLRLIAIYNAISWYKSDIPAEIVKTLVTEQIRNIAITQLLFNSYFPLAAGILTFILWKTDHYVKRKDIQNEWQRKCQAEC